MSILKFEAHEWLSTKIALRQCCAPCCPDLKYAAYSLDSLGYLKYTRIHSYTTSSCLVNGNLPRNEGGNAAEIRNVCNRACWRKQSRLTALAEG